MSAIGNLIWFVFGGIFMGLGWFFVGMLAAISIVGIPWARACFVIASMSFFPFGNEAISRYELTLERDIGTGGFGVVGNVIWFIVAGWWLTLGHLCCAIFWIITIIGIPFGLQHLKLAGLSIAPIGKTVVSKDYASAARRANARVAVVNLRRRYSY